MKSDMSDTNYHGEETSADTYTTLRRHHFNIESLEERLQRMENTTATMKEKWCRGDEAMRDFTDIARIQQSTKASHQTSIDRGQHSPIDFRQPTSIDPCLPALIDISPPHSHPMQPSHNFHTKEEIDQLVEEIYRALETTKEMLDGRCD
ncbi:hypothetical protein DY000_02049104 [Brassica cretica]|uniref:Uncharacterized protein n=1 Tax=Brassica cretica TaxID=69181 RepID=A0ABQ7EWE3_BRACR|nr:hypothetical protein DY000_02049104 [Brassica cretica]